MVSNIPDKMWVELESVALSSRRVCDRDNSRHAFTYHWMSVSFPLRVLYSLLFSHLGRFLDEK